ncbi:MAG TPA: hypothetical protein VIJ25_20030, partial [Methylococcales bacterium]
MISSSGSFKHRSYYVNFSSHLLNAWNANVLFPDATPCWKAEDFIGLLDMLKAFGYTCFEYWLVPDMYDPASLENKGKYKSFALMM